MVEKTTRISELVNSMLSYDRPDLGIAQSWLNLTHRHQQGCPRLRAGQGVLGTAVEECEI